MWYCAQILVNAIDNHARDKTTTRIDVRLPEPGDVTPTFSVRNNGRGIPVQFHSGEQVRDVIFVAAGSCRARCDIAETSLLQFV